MDQHQPSWRVPERHPAELGSSVQNPVFQPAHKAADEGLVRLEPAATGGEADARSTPRPYSNSDADARLRRLTARPNPTLRCRCHVGGVKSCFDPQSPPFTLSGVPAGTRHLRFAMKDLDAPDFVHGGGTIAYDGQPGIPRGAFPYRGPCPPQGQHRYQWTVEAQDAAGKTLAAATITKNFPPK